MVVVAQKVGDMVSPRTGRPKSENPKGIEVKARIDAETDMRLQDYCRKHNKTRTDVVREGIELILGQKNENSLTPWKSSRLLSYHHPKEAKSIIAEPPGKFKEVLKNERNEK